MEIKTKFAIGDKVWTIHECKPKQMRVTTISINGVDEVKYAGEIPASAISVFYHCVKEAECFATKEELIKHITSE